ncbi:hypothetical protein O6H91_12G032600 [Diphasiastrum complanatum]|uniref:Uncharacterized protein n=1 Tax=Diphasiastrum complanatum TaxID=34168 RepID=A0ACC2C051_DIPCM|nr:hypothetical protein O6H91_12G032600 [Diphasiastrum complanatum]
MAVEQKRAQTGEFFAKLDAHRRHPMLNNNLKNALPGFGIAVVAFGIYLLVDGMTSKFASSPSSKDASH